MAADVGPTIKPCPKCKTNLTQGRWRLYCKKCGYVPKDGDGGDFYNKVKRDG